MNLILKKMLDDAKKREDNSSSPPILVNIRAEKQDRPLPNDLMEKLDIPYGDPKHGLFADVVYPKESKTDTLPVFVFVHGGALVTGDRRSNRVFAQELARYGFVVYSVEYRLIDRADAIGMVSDVCCALRMVKDTLESFGGDPKRVSLCGESAGAFISLYAAASEKSQEYRRMLGCGECGLFISHLILFSGMIYTTGNDIVSLLYKRTLYREKTKDPVFMSFAAPENPALISALPPVFLVSSKADFLRGHTLKFAAALKRCQHDVRLLYYPKGKELTHAFPTLLPSLPESKQVLESVANWIKSGY